MTLLQKLTEEKVEPFFDKWAEMQELIGQMHEARDPDVKTMMHESISLYKELLMQCRDDELEGVLVPLNGQERLEFVESRLEAFASYRQLDGLFMEMKKMIAGTRAKLRNSSRQHSESDILKQ